MSDADLIVVFDLLETGYKDWWFPASGLLFVAIGILLIRYRERSLELFNLTSTPKFYNVFSKFWLGFAIFWVLITFVATFGSYWSLSSAYRSGNFETVEGLVENFVQKGATGRKGESFEVAGVTFEYSDFRVTPGFNNTRAYGGPINAGVHVRISHVYGEIVRLEVERSAIQAPGPRPDASI